MKLRVPSKALIPLALASTLVVLVAVLGYLSLTGRPSRPEARPAPQASAPLRTAPIVPPASTSTPPGGAGPAAGTSGGQPSPATPSPTGTPPAAGAPGGVKPAQGTMAPTSSASQPATPASTRPATAQPNSEAAVVGTGQRGRGDPFSPLATPEQRATRGPSLPPPPGVGLPMPPGFTTPGGPTPPPPPGAGMRVAGIMGSHSRVAIIEADGKTYIVGAGERVGDAVVISIMPNKVVMKQNNVTFELGFGGDRSS